MSALTDRVAAEARAKASAAVAQGVEDLRAAVAKAPEFERWDSPDGRTFHWVPVRAQMAGMLAFIEQALADGEVAA